MKNKLIFVILITAILFIVLLSCEKASNNYINDTYGSNSFDKTSDAKDKIQLWYYNFSEDQGVLTPTLKLAEIIKQFCDENKIPLEIHEYNKNTLLLGDYIFKRNIAAATGNMITIDHISNIRDLSKQHADYTKIENYNNLLSAYKGEFCIPLGVGYFSLYIENDAMEYYDIDIKKPLITHTDYLEIKQEMKRRGARFELNGRELFELMDYYLSINELLFLDEKSEILDNDNIFKEKLKKAIIGVCNDILLYYDNSLDTDKPLRPSALTDHIYDENSELALMGDAFNGTHSLINLDEYQNINDITNKTFYIYPFNPKSTPCLYIYKKITNDKIYDIANHILKEETYIKIMQNYNVNIPVFNIDKAKIVLGLNDNLEFVKSYEGSSRIKEIIDIAYEMTVKNENKSKEIAKIYFSNVNYSTTIKFFIRDIIHDIARELSGDKLSLEKFNSKNEKINNMIDKKIDDFIINFKVHNN